VVEKVLISVRDSYFSASNSSCFGKPTVRIDGDEQDKLHYIVFLLVLLYCFHTFAASYDVHIPSASQLL
jgi:hypothetical protein